MAVGGEGVVVLGPHPGHVLGLLGELGPESLGIGPERVEGTLEAEEGVDLLAQQQRGFDLVAQAGHLGLEPVHTFAGVAQPGLGRRLGLDDPLDLLFGHRELAAEPLETGNLALDFFAAFPKGVEFSRSLQDRGERPQVVRGGFGAGDKRLQRGGNISARSNRRRPPSRPRGGDLSGN